MKYSVITLIIVSVNYVTLLSNALPATDKSVDDSVHYVDNSEVFMFVDQMPSFNGGGISKFREYIKSNIEYPAKAKEQSISGKVIVKFVIDKEGNLTDIQLANSVHPLLDNEALRVIKSCPKWVPGKQQGQVVKVQYIIPVNFLNDRKANKFLVTF